VETEEFSASFSQLVDHWAALGVWCALWSPEGKLLTTAPQSPGLWKTLWTRGQRFRKAVCAAVEGCHGESRFTSLLGIEGLNVCCAPLALADGVAVTAVICYVQDCRHWGEDFSRLCSEWEIDEQLLSGWARRCARFTPTHVEHIVELLREECRGLLRVSHQQVEVSQMTAHLAEAYEELNLIYRVGALMQLTQRPREHFTRLFEILAAATPITTMAAILTCDDILRPEDQLIIGGEPIVGEAAVRRLVASLPADGVPAGKPLIVNKVSAHPELHWARGWLEQFMAVAVVCSERRLGLALLINRRGQADFTSIDARLVQSVMDRSAVYLENVHLYAGLSRLLMGLTRALVSAIDAKDPYTCGHSTRVAEISKRIALHMGANPQQAERVYLSALLHDVGKIGIPEAILCKAGRLSDEETKVMQRHPEIGARILGGIPQLDDIIPGVLHHHESLSGHGYPHGLHGDQIPYLARVVGLADAFDAMTSGRTYRGALPLQAAMAEIRRCSGTQFCPHLADALVELVDAGLADELRVLQDGPVFQLDVLGGAGQP
jgi:HD-GYP domain-containing protein (c-di-GMP phosphodiesterase class II)